jgi:hypothetical protein
MEHGKELGLRAEMTDLADKVRRGAARRFRSWPPFRREVPEPIPGDGELMV